MLLYCLKNRFGEAGAKRIERNSFVLSDDKTTQDINLSAQWERCFHPGQQVVMSMVFDRSLSGNLCPSCRTENAGNCDQDIAW
jgi:hypothetical protein